jgi:hypothetical protein
MAGGKTYSQLSAQAQAQPNNTKLAAEVSTVFKGETLRSMLLNAYGWWKVSQLTYVVSLVMFGLGTVSFLGGVFRFTRIRRARPSPSWPGVRVFFQRSRAQVCPLRSWPKTCSRSSLTSVNPAAW